MLYLYIISRWIILIPIYSFTIIHILIGILNKIDISICEDYFSYCALIIGFFIIIFFDKKIYTNINRNKLDKSQKFKKAIGVILSAHSILVITLLIIKWQLVLSFFALPIAILIFILYFSGFSEAYNEILKYKKNNKTE